MATLWYQLSCHISKDIYLIVIIGWMNKAFLRKQKKIIFRIISYSVVGLYRSCNSVLYKECYHQPWIQKYKFFKNLRNNNFFSKEFTFPPSLRRSNFLNSTKSKVVPTYTHKILIVQKFLLHTLQFTGKYFLIKITFYQSKIESASLPAAWLLNMIILWNMYFS